MCRICLVGRPPNRYSAIQSASCKTRLDTRASYAEHASAATFLINRDGPAWMSRPDVQAGRLAHIGRREERMTRNVFDPTDRPGTLRVEPQANDILALSLVGEFDMANAPSIGTEGEQALRAGNHVILDLSDATFIDSSAIAALFTVANGAITNRRVAVLQLGTAAIVEKMLELSRIERVLPRVHTRSEALHAIRELEADSDQPD